MAKKRKSKRKSSLGPRRRRRTEGGVVLVDLFEVLKEARQMIHTGRAEQAVDILESLAREAPADQEIQSKIHVLLWVAYYALDDFDSAHRTGERMLETMPNDPQSLHLCASARLNKGWMFWGIELLRKLVSRYPDYHGIDKAEDELARAEMEIPDLLDDLALQGKQGEKIAALLDEAQFLTQNEMFQAAIETLRKAVQQKPDFSRALVLIGEIQFLQGKLEDALREVRAAIEINKENPLAFAALARFLNLTQRVEEAEQAAYEIDPAAGPGVEGWAKDAEARMIVGDYVHVANTLRMRQQWGMKHERPLDAELYHLAAVAEMRLGNTRRARKLWRRAANASEGAAEWAQLAEENLYDLFALPWERDVPWPFEQEYWFPTAWSSALEPLLPPRRLRFRKTSEEVKAFVKEHPNIVRCTSMLLQNGDPDAREFAVRLACAADTTEMRDILREYAMGDRGPDLQRVKVAMHLVRAGELQAGLMPMWLHGKEEQVVLLPCEVQDEDKEKYPASIADLVDKIVALLNVNKGAEAEPLIREAMEEAPDEPDLFQYLCRSYRLQGRIDESKELAHEIRERFPNDQFGRTAMAIEQIEKGYFDEAHELLEPLLVRSHCRPSELKSLCHVMIELLINEDEFTAARGWTNLLRAFAPDERRLGLIRWKTSQSRFGGLLRKLVR